MVTLVLFLDDGTVHFSRQCSGMVTTALPTTETGGLFKTIFSLLYSIKALTFRSESAPCTL
jgi:hypothetical protein